MKINSPEKTSLITAFLLKSYKSIYPHWYNDTVKDQTLSYFEHGYLTIIPDLNPEHIKLVYKDIKDKAYEGYQSKPPSAYDFEILVKKKGNESINDDEKLKIVNINKCAILILLKQKIPEYLKEFEEDARLMANALKE